MLDDLDLSAAFVFCSAAGFSDAQRNMAGLWEAAATAQNPSLRILNRPSLVRPWHELMAGLTGPAGSMIEIRSLQNQLADPRFPVVLRYQSAEFQVDSPIIEDRSALFEIVDRMVMSGALPAGIHALWLPNLESDSGLNRGATILRLGGTVLPLGGQVTEEQLAEMNAAVAQLPLEAAAFDFLLTDRGPVLFRIDDELWRILPLLAEPTSAAGPTPLQAAVLDAIEALGPEEPGGWTARVSLESVLVQRALFDHSGAA